ncbi:hypothetical protein OIU80_19935 [Flavobacterium sp. LS1R47]|uniref:Baseplate structural protein Gp10 C-terminal domain-containing protein n=1 Tax=Flavobacterium frigoritolerans TaxID=2987686 RepID=A0A9X3CAF2_9FLAO|nr:hypothetical protein [Flavobacterium frigoritolerans]MCV9934558.1 hypothetical protein [Flavobacterium frigoritolerans]
MNRSYFNQTNGYPLNTERLQELQTAYEIFNSLGSIAGDFTIISGCVQSGTTIQNGFVFINGELLEFVSAAVTPTSTVIIVETPVTRPFETGPDKVVYIKRHVTFGTADISWPWSLFKRPIQTKDIQDALDKKQDKTSAGGDLLTRIEVLEKKNAVFQAGGGMVLWNKPANQIPTGWAEVVNWRGRIPVGFDASQPEFSNMGKMGGNKNKNLEIAELPEHNFSYKDSYFLSDEISNNYISGREDTGRTYYATASADNNNRYLYYKNRISENVGSNQAFSLLNPYRVVLFIEYIG